MKKTFNYICTLAALLMAGAAFTACSSDDSIVEEQPVVNPSEPVYTLTIKASNDGASTRALDLDGAGKLTASWADGDQLTVVNVTKSNSPLGYMTASNASGNTADFTGTLSGTIDENDVLLLTYHPITSVSAFESQDGTLKGTNGAEKFDMATATVTVNKANAGKITIKETEASFTTKVAMIKLTLQDNVATPNKLNATTLKVSATFTISPYPAITQDVLTFTIPASTYTDTDGGDGILYFALPSKETVAAQLYSKYTKAPYDLPITLVQALDALDDATITFTATVGGTNYAVNKTGYKFVAGKYYKATLTMAEVVTWDNTNVFVSGNSEVTADKDNPYTYGGVSISFSGNSWLQLYDSGQDVTKLIVRADAVCTFTAPSGKKFTRIEITDNFYATFTAYGDWAMDGEAKAIWSGTASNTVTLGSSENSFFTNLKSIVFTMIPSE